MIESSPSDVDVVLTGLRSADPRQRRLSARSFGDLELGDPLRVLEPLLNDIDANVRCAAVDALEEIDTPQVEPLLLELAATDTSPEVREAALMGLHKYQSPQILAFLVSETARSSELPRHVRQLLAEQLGNYDAEKAVDGLVELIDDPDAYVRERAIESLSKHNRPRLRELWKLVAREWKEMEWGKIAEGALQDLKNQRTKKGSSKQIIENKLSRAESDSRSKDPAIRRDAIRRLLFLSPPDLFDQLEHFCKDEDPNVRASAARALEEITDRRTFPLLLDLLLDLTLNDSSEMVQSAAVHALGAHPNPGALKALLEIAKDPVAARSADVRANIALALGDYVTADARKTLEQLSQDTDAIVRSTALESLERLESLQKRSDLASPPKRKASTESNIERKLKAMIESFVRDIMPLLKKALLEEVKLTTTSKTEQRTSQKANRVPRQAPAPGQQRNIPTTGTILPTHLRPTDGEGSTGIVQDQRT